MQKAGNKYNINLIYIIYYKYNINLIYNIYLGQVFVDCDQKTTLYMPTIILWCADNPEQAKMNLKKEAFTGLIILLFILFIIIALHY